MLLLDRNALVTISPGTNNPPAGQYRWSAHVSLPYPFPLKDCLRRKATISGREYDFSIHNHFDRLFVAHKSNCSAPRVFLHDRRRELNEFPEEWVLSREYLQSVALFEETTSFSSPNEAFADATQKIQRCFDYLSDFLRQCHSSAPYLTAWLVYPISFFDVGTVYHSTHWFNEQTQQWEVFASAPAISSARRLHDPLFILDVHNENRDDDTLIESTNELLAEAQMSLYRGLPRLTVLNAYGAVESLANAIFKAKKTELFAKHGLPSCFADEVEDERKRHRTDAKFLFHTGMMSACGRSLHDEDKTKYDALISLQQTRHLIAHTGHKPSPDEARDAHRLCCECTQWLSDVGGFQVKPLFPDEKSQSQGFVSVGSDSHALSTGELAFLRKSIALLDRDISPTDVFADLCLQPTPTFTVAMQGIPSPVVHNLFGVLRCYTKRILRMIDRWL